MHPVFEAEHPIAAAHRGSRILWPENTMPAYQGAIDLGYRFIETDLHLTADGVLVTFHDDSLHRTTDRKGYVWDLHSDELGDVDAAANFMIDGEKPLQGKGVGIPTLAQVVTAFPDASFILDMKQDGLEQALLDFINEHELEDRVIVGSFSDRRLSIFRSLAKGRIATSSGPKETRGVRLRSLTRLAASGDADALQVPVFYGVVKVVDKPFIRAAHKAGKQVHVWTINKRSEMERLLDLGVDGIITDRPDILKDVMIERGGGPW